MRINVVIPVWNGADVIAGCLDAVHTHSGQHQPEVVCVDNDSRDGSARLIEEAYPWVRLIRQPVNLGFAGGVNAGIEASGGDLFVLLNQDCIVRPGWLDALCAAFNAAPALGVAGCTILKADGSVDHTGAQVRRPDAAGVHRTYTSAEGWTAVDYVTGAAMAIRRSTWEAVGRFDEGFYPAYYEDADYCYRARRHGFLVGCVPGAQVTHLFSSQAWQRDALAHTTNYHRARYRFVGKHFDADEIDALLAAEATALKEEAYLDQAMGRAIAARDMIRALPDVVARRQADLGELPPALYRHLAVALSEIRHLALAAAARLLDVGLEEPPVGAWQARNQALRQDLAGGLPSLPAEDARTRRTMGETAFLDALAALREEENELLARLHFHPPEPSAESTWRRRLRHTILRLLSVLTGREDVLQTRLHALYLQHLDLMARQIDVLGKAAIERDAVYHRRLDLLRTLQDEHEQQAAWLWEYDLERLERRIELLRTLAEHE
ncbi:MAG: glycosyltransferase [Anaerolineae bacterium]|nr:glycosyltransferase [Anaerolineae bacterium]